MTKKCVCVRERERDDDDVYMLCMFGTTLSITVYEVN
ncbi:MAG: hypothetical protein ACI8RD_009873 [Bacillariaceae sp.]|jgi:hypothetical protein